MARRLGWLHFGAGFTACLLAAGCLSHSAEREQLFTGLAPSPTPAVPPVSRLQAEAPVEIVSPYANQPDEAIHRAAVIEPPSELGNVVITPVLESLWSNQPDKPPAPPLLSSPTVKESPLLSAFRCVLEKNPEEARLLLEQYDQPDRRQLLALLRLTADVGAGNLPPGEAEELLDQLQDLIGQLRRRAPLTMGTVCFCRKIEGFGQYHALEPGYCFQSGCDSRPGERVQVYAEVRNFSSRLHEGQYETVLNTTLEILKAGGGTTDQDIQRRKVVMMNLGACIDRSCTPRQDYYLNFRFHVPARLPPGLYTLWVTVKDATPGQTLPRVARRSLDFKVCPPGSPRSR
jgi:hypothetical protein